MNVDDCLKNVEDLVKSLKLQLDGDQKDIFNFEQKATSMVNILYKKECLQEIEKTQHEMKTSFPNKSVLHSLFKEEPEETFFFKDDYGRKRKLLNAERKAEYNAFLQQKEMERWQHKKVLEETHSVVPKSILESVDYDKLLAKRKDEESKFRDINCANPKVKEVLSRPQDHMKENCSLPSEVEISLPSRKVLTAQKPESSKSPDGRRPPRDRSIFGDYPPRKKDTAYRQELLQQMEEKRRLAELERERLRQLEERDARLAQEQRRRIQLEYEEEAKRTKQAQEKLQRDRLRRLQEFQEREATLRNQRPVEQPPNVRDEIPEDLVPRPPSPPVPAVRSCVLLEKKSSPVITVPEVKEENIFSSLAEIRRKIMQDHQKLKKDASESSYEVTNRRIVGDVGEEY